MAIFVCDECGTMENTALGHYWGRGLEDFQIPEKKGKALCSACAPHLWKDGSSTKWGAWHGKFNQVKWDGKRKVINR